MIASIQMADVRAQVRVKVKRLDRRDVVQIHIESRWLGFAKDEKRDIKDRLWN